MEGLHTLSEFADAAVAEVQATIKAQMAELNKHKGVIESLREFAAAVDWTEPWIQGLLACHAALLLAVLLLRKNAAFQGGAFFAIMAAVYSAEWLNAAAAARWESFARQPYFDAHGIFASVLWSAPLLAVMFVILINYLVMMSAMMVKAKRQELRYKARQRARAERGAAAEESKKDS